MSSVGRDIENAIQSMLAISDEFATLQAKLDKATNDLSILETLFSVSKYIGSDPEINVVLAVLEDSVKGVFGASECHVIFSAKRRYLSDSDALYQYLNYEELCEKVDDILFIKDAVESDLTTIDQGAMLIIRLAVGDELYGFLAIHWSFYYELSNSSLIFLRIISNQVSMYLKSAKLVEEFKNLAVLDPLTAIYNRSYFSNIESTTLPKLDDSLIIFDLDKFKNINDNYGHQYGDKVLKQFARLLEDHAFASDSTALRYGGEEFLIKSHGGVDKAFKIAEAVRKDFEKKTGFTVSAGISTCGDSCNVANFKHLLEVADESLYISKKSGRNRTTISTSDLQIVKTIALPISKLISRAFRENEYNSIFRLVLVSPTVISEEQYAKLKQVVTSATRMYDEVHFTPSLDVMIVINGNISEKEFISRVENLIKRELDDIDYKIFSLTNSLKRVVSRSRELSELAVAFSKNIKLDDDTIKRIRLFGEWHDVGKIFIAPQHNGLVDGKKLAVKKLARLNKWLSYNIASQQPLLDGFSEWFLHHHKLIDGELEHLNNSEELDLPTRVVSMIEQYSERLEQLESSDAKSIKKAITSIRRLKKNYGEELVEQFAKYIQNI